MTTEERNKWIVENNEKIVECLQRYCDRNKQLNYDELYQDTMVYLIDYLDKKGIPKRCLSNVLGNFINRVLKSKERYETPVDFFEVIFLQDFDFESSAIVKALITKAGLEENGYLLNLVKDIAVDGYSFREAGKKYLLSESAIRRDYVDALHALRTAAIKIKYYSLNERD